MLNERRRILLVDDDRAILSILCAIFESQSYETAAANSGEEAIEVASSFQPECIVSDIRMGAINGIEAALKILGGGLPECKVLFISGEARSRDLLADAIARDFNFEVLEKPVPVRELLRKVSQLVSDSTGQDGDCAHQHCTMEGRPCRKELPRDAKAVALRNGAA